MIDTRTGSAVQIFPDAVIVPWDGTAAVTAELHEGAVSSTASVEQSDTVAKLVDAPAMLP